MKARPRITTLAVRSCFRPALLHYGRTTPIPHPAAPWLNLNSAAPMSSQCISKRAFRPHLILRVGWRGLMQQCLRSYHQGLIDIVAPTTMSYIESNSVGNGSDQVAVSPGQRSHVGSPPDQPTDQHQPLPPTYFLATTESATRMQPGSEPSGSPEDAKDRAREPPQSWA